MQCLYQGKRWVLRLLRCEFQMPEAVMRHLVSLFSHTENRTEAAARRECAERWSRIVRMLLSAGIAGLLLCTLCIQPVRAASGASAVSGPASPEQVAEGGPLFTTYCGPCHSTGQGGLDIMPLTAHLTRLGLASYIEGQGLIFDHMPVFTGNREERDAIAAYVMEGLHGKREAVEAPRPLPQLPVPVPPFDAASAEHVLLVWNTLGMKCITDCDAAYSYLPPGNALGAVLIRRGAKPQLVSEGVEVRYAAPEGFRNPSRHVRYWEFAASISGKVLDPDTSVTGKGMQGEMAWNPKSATFEAAGIPVVPYGDDGTVNPYPLFAVQAVESGSGKVLASTSVVVPVGTEMSCWRCHGGEWGRPADGTGVSMETARSILTVHDRRSGTDLLARSEAGKPVLCQSCHPDPLLNAKGDPARLNLPAALHGFHVNYLKGGGAETCSYCHPDSTIGLTRCLRDSHGTAGMTCVPCHGYLEDHALSLLKKEKEIGKERAELFMRAVSPRSVPDVAAINARTPWAQQPDCLTCHTEAYVRPGRDAVAFNTWTADASVLYRVRKDMTGTVPCIACHNSPHATHPSDNPFGKDRDAMQPLQYQQLNAAIGAQGNCQVCHGPDSGLTPEMSPHHPMPPVGR